MSSFAKTHRRLWHAVTAAEAKEHALHRPGDRVYSPPDVTASAVVAYMQMELDRVRIEDEARARLEEAKRARIEAQVHAAYLLGAAAGAALHPNPAGLIIPRCARCAYPLQDTPPHFGLAPGLLVCAPCWWLSVDGGSQ